MIRGADAGASSEPPSTTAAAPSVKELHMSRVSTPATWGDSSTSSIGHRALALGQRVAGRVAERLDRGGGDLADGRARRPSCSRWAHTLLRPMRMLPAGLSSACAALVQVVRGTPPGRPSSMPAIVCARSPVHIFSTPRASTGRSGLAAAMVARCSAELPPAHELSTLTMAASLRPALRSQVWPAHAALVAQAAGHGVARR